MTVPLSKNQRFEMTLGDRYTGLDGSYYMTGLQALVRLPIQQRIRDEANNLKTGGFISGYRGSPLGRYDMELWEAASELEERNIIFQPGVNEDLAATAVWGSQYVGQFPGAKVDGVFSIWYGKAPGMDRSMDPIRHMNLAGTSVQGGVLLLVGDDPGAKSSTVACYSDYNFVSSGIPMFAPANAQDVLDFGLHAIALSRFSGCVAGLKLVTDVVEGGGSVFVSPASPAITLPERRVKANIQIFSPFLQQEQLLYTHRLENALAYIRSNNVNTISVSAPQAKIGIVAAGKAWQDVAQGLRELGIKDGKFSFGEIRLLKVGVPWPLDNEIIEEFAEGLETVIVVEEKRPLLEDQIKSILYRRVSAPKIVGKFFDGMAYASGCGDTAFPNYGEVTPDLVCQVLSRVLMDAYPDWKADSSCSPEGPVSASTVQRPPTFCSGCPHGRSTLLPEGSRAMAGIGCHSMAMLKDPVHTNSMSHMGGEGAMWIGQKPFTDEEHVFTNMGDGTYFHSGLLAIRAAVAANVPITYKILHNGFVSMTGGQPVDGEISPRQMIDQLLAEGVKKIALVADELEKYRASDLPEGVSLHPRHELEAVQISFRKFPSVSAIIYDQPCATERRRLRKRGKWPDLDKRVFINSAVCEGCGDCSTVSQCMSIEPLETEYGRKRVINQSSCNKDISCIEGFCPSFVTVSGSTLKQAKASALLDDDFSDIPAPDYQAIDGSFAVLISGIGGGGVVTVGQTLAVAAHLDGLFSSNLDVTGLAQKYGAVHSHIKFSREPHELYATRVATHEANTIIGCDLVVASGTEAISKLNPTIGQVIADCSFTPTSEFSKNPDWSLDLDAMADIVQKASGGRAAIFDARKVAVTVLGDTIYTNMILLGAAWQCGGLPLSLEAVFRAIELNGVKIDQNKKAFSVGRLAVHAPDSLEQALKSGPKVEAVDFDKPKTSTLKEIIEDRMGFLTDYQDVAYAKKYEECILKISAKEALLECDDKLAVAAARYYFKLLASKDAWEVARLYSRPEFIKRLRETFDGDLKLTFHSGAWPFARHNKTTGKLTKGAVGGWLLTVFGIMAKLRFLRGSILDPFRNNSEAKLARRLLAEYEADIEFALENLRPDNREDFVALLSLPERIRGYGHVREKNALAVAKARDTILKKLK